MYATRPMPDDNRFERAARRGGNERHYISKINELDDENKSLKLRLRALQSDLHRGTSTVSIRSQKGANSGRCANSSS